jgi:hypothetical protein
MFCDQDFLVFSFQQQRRPYVISELDFSARLVIVVLLIEGLPLFLDTMHTYPKDKHEWEG